MTVSGYPKKLKIAFIVPKTQISDIAPPLNIATLAAYVLEKNMDVDVKIFDGTVDSNAYVELYKYSPDVLAVTATTPQIYEAYRLLETMKTLNPNIFTIIGGVHVTALPEEATKHADCVVVGEGEIVLSKIITDLQQRKQIPRIIEGVEFEDLDKLPFPAFELLSMEKYLHRKIDYIPTLKTTPLIRLITSRGCTGRCPFCHNSQRKTKVRYHSAKYLIALIELLKGRYGIKSIWFHDDEFVENKQRLSMFLAIYQAKGLHKQIKWACQAKVLSVTPETAKQLKQAGCKLVFLGIESASKSLGFLKCGTVKPIDAEKALQACKDAKLSVYGSFIFASINESLSDMQQTWDWIQSHRKKGLTYYGFGVLAPFPGSTIYNYALKQGVFTQENVDYNRITNASNLKDVYLLDAAITRAELECFVMPKILQLWAESQIANRNIRGILTPTFFKTYFASKDLLNIVRK